MVRIIKHLLLALTYGLLGSFVVIVGLYVYQLDSRPDLKVLHQAALDVEFHAGLAGEITTLEQYQQREAQLFEQLEEQVYARIDAADRRSINRFSYKERFSFAYSLFDEFYAFKRNCMI